MESGFDPEEPLNPEAVARTRRELLPSADAPGFAWAAAKAFAKTRGASDQDAERYADRFEAAVCACECEECGNPAEFMENTDPSQQGVGVALGAALPAIRRVYMLRCPSCGHDQVLGPARQITAKTVSDR